jgi:galactan endo-1,6-beta-galactosidase
MAVARGVNSLELFSNSPPWWMLKNLNPSGSDDGTSDNLLQSRWGDHALYMATVAAQLKARFGLNFTTIEATNEPIAGWWKSTGTQEGCHFDASSQAALQPLLRAALDAQGLTSVRIAASDESTTDMAVSTWSTFGAETKKIIDQVNVHGYEGMNGDREGLYNAVVRRDGKRLHMSEHGDGDASGLQLVQQLHADFALLHPMSWTYWQSFDSASGWTLIGSDPSDGTISDFVNDKYFVVAQFSRHIRPGMSILETTDGGSACASLCANMTIAAFDAASHVLVVAATNLGSTPLQGVIDLSAFTAATGPVTRWQTTPGQGGDKYAKYSGPAPNGGAVSFTWPAGTVVTMQIEGVQV